MSQERTISEQILPISRQTSVAPTLSQSPTSKRVRSLSMERKRRTRKEGDPQFAQNWPGSPVTRSKSFQPTKKEAKKLEIRNIPKNPKTSTVASKKLKQFHGKGSPMKRSIPASGVSKKMGRTSPTLSLNMRRQKIKMTKKSRLLKRLSPKMGWRNPGSPPTHRNEDSSLELSRGGS